MFVCLCNGITNNKVAEVVAQGASTTKQIAEACGAGADCGRCRRTLRAIISSMNGSVDSATRPPRAGGAPSALRRSCDRR